MSEATEEKNKREQHLVLNCRHCEAKNRIEIDQAVLRTEEAKCGQCQKALFLIGEDEFFTGIDPFAYEHPWDRAALNTLKQVPGVGTMLRFLLRESAERYWHLLTMQCFVQVTPDHLGEIHRIYERTGRVLDMGKLPDLYIYQDPQPNAFTYGVEKGVVCVSSGAVDLLSEEELVFLFGHELAHVQMDHILLRTAAILILKFGFGIFGPMLGIGGSLLMPVAYALLHWYRCSELSADRGGMLAVKKFYKAINVQMKLAGGSQRIAAMMDAEQYLKQAEETQKKTSESVINTLLIAHMSSELTHPFMIWRSGALKTWAYSGDYLDILAGKYRRRKGDETPKKISEDDFQKTEKEEDFFDQMRKFFTFS